MKLEGQKVYVLEALLRGELVEREIIEVKNKGGKITVFLSRFPMASEFFLVDLIFDRDKASKICHKALKKHQKLILEKISRLPHLQKFFSVEAGWPGSAD